MFSGTYEIEASVLLLEYLRDIKNSRDFRNTWTVSRLRSMISTLQSNFTQIRLLSIEHLHVFNQYILVRVLGIHNYFPQSISGRKGELSINRDSFYRISILNCPYIGDSISRNNSSANRSGSRVAKRMKSRNHQYDCR